MIMPEQFSMGLDVQTKGGGSTSRRDLMTLIEGMSGNQFFVRSEGGDGGNKGKNPGGGFSLICFYTYQNPEEAGLGQVFPL